MQSSSFLPNLFYLICFCVYISILYAQQIFEKRDGNNVLESRLCFLAPDIYIKILKTEYCQVQLSKILISFSIAKEVECPQISENHPGALTRWQATVAPIRGAARTIVSLCHTMSPCHTVSPCHYVTPCHTGPDQPIERCHCISISLNREHKVPTRSH